VIEVPFGRPRAQEMVAEREFQELVLRAYSGLQVPLTDAADNQQAGVHGG